MENKFDLIVTIVNRGYSDYVVDASRTAGASGGTILFARGTNINEATDSFMGVAIQPEKDIVLTLVETSKKHEVMNEICNKANLDQGNRGICFSIPVSNVAGLKGIIKKAEEKASEKTSKEKK